MLHLLVLQLPSLLASRTCARTATSSSRAAASMLASTEIGKQGAAKPTIYFVMGGPGSGKGTQCEKLIQSYGMVHLSAGDLLRAEVKSGSAEGRKIAKIIEEGKIVVSETTVGLLRKAMSQAEGPFLIDGFPRSMSNLQAFEAEMGPCEFMLFLEVPLSTPSTPSLRPALVTDHRGPFVRAHARSPRSQVSEAEMEKRLLKRGVSSGRSDDNAETIRKRFHTFVSESMPVMDELERRGVVHKVSAEASADEVYSRVCETLGRHPRPVLPKE